MKKTTEIHKKHPIDTDENNDWKILILCYNISLSQGIKQLVQHMMSEPDSLFDFDFDGQVQDNKDKMNNIFVRNFHEWLKLDLKINETQIPHYIEKIDQGQAILPKYDAILIDEGQDFEPEWLHLVSKLLKAESQSLLLVEDRAQSIYSRKRQDTGLSFQGRSKILSINYRNTAQIVKFAWDFYQKHSHLKSKVVQGEIEGVEIIPPQSTKRSGLEPAILKPANFWDEMKIVTEQIKKLHEKEGVPFSEMLILYRVKNTYKLSIIDIIKRSLEKEQLPFYWLTQDEKSKRNYQKDDNTVKISTIDSSKGLDFQAVFVVNVDNMPFPLEENKEREVSLLYIAMTRAKNYLAVSYSGESEFTQYFEEIKRLRELEKEERATK